MHRLICTGTILPRHVWRCCSGCCFDPRFRRWRDCHARLDVLGGGIAGEEKPVKAKKRVGGGENSKAGALPEKYGTVLTYIKREKIAKAGQPVSLTTGDMAQHTWRTMARCVKSYIRCIGKPPTLNPARTEFSRGPFWPDGPNAAAGAANCRHLYCASPHSALHRNLHISSTCTSELACLCLTFNHAHILDQTRLTLPAAVPEPLLGAFLYILSRACASIDAVTISQPLFRRRHALYHTSSRAIDKCPHHPAPPTRSANWRTRIWLGSASR